MDGFVHLISVGSRTLPKRICRFCERIGRCSIRCQSCHTVSFCNEICKDLDGTTEQPHICNTEQPIKPKYGGISTLMNLLLWSKEMKRAVYSMFLKRSQNGKAFEPLSIMCVVPESMFTHKSVDNRLIMQKATCVFNDRVMIPLKHGLLFRNGRTLRPDFIEVSIGIRSKQPIVLSTLFPYPCEGYERMLRMRDDGHIAMSRDAIIAQILENVENKIRIALLR